VHARAYPLDVTWWVLLPRQSWREWPHRSARLESVRFTAT